MQNLDLFNFYAPENFNVVSSRVSMETDDLRYWLVQQVTQQEANWI